MRPHLSIIYSLLLVAIGLGACAGDDYMPQYFPSSDDEGAGDIVAPPTPIGGSSCTIQFNSSICVVLKRGTWSRGGEGQEPICIDDLKPIPIRIEGGKAILRGDEFPDILISGHGLEAPITINGRGTTDGTDNIGGGAVDGSGNITIKNFTFYAAVLSKVGKIPDITLTTGTVEGSKDLPEIHGSPASGTSMTLVGSKILGPIFPAADKYLLGATMQVTFKGSISPKLSECSGKGGSNLPTSVQVTKITVDTQKRQHEQSIPAGTQMEVAGNIVIPEDEHDVGDHFEGTSRFRIRNISKNSIPLQIPPIVGAFRIKALTGDLTSTLPPQQAMMIQVSFHPTPSTKAGRVQESLGLGSDFFTLVGVAQESRGIPSVHTTDSSGTVNPNSTNTIQFPEVGVAAFSRQAYFQCASLQCSGVASPTHCQPCVDVASKQCQLLSIDSADLPIGEVDAQCTQKRPKAKESQGLNLQGGKSAASAQTIVIRNDGTKPMEILSLEIAELPNSHSTGQFHVSSIALPFTIPPHSTQTVSVVVNYSPTDLLGADDDQSGNTVLDQAILVMKTLSAKKTQTTRIKLRGTTTIQESPPLEIYFKNSIGLKMPGDGGTYPIKGITQTTQSMAVPVMARLADSAGHALRITNVEISGTDTEHFAWLDTAEKISDCNTSATPVVIRPNGFTLKPGAYSKETMPLLGCIAFKQTPEVKASKRIYETQLLVTAVALDAQQRPLKRDDGSLAESKVSIRIQAVINPRMGPQVFRIVQTMAILMIKSNPTVASSSSSDEVEVLIAQGRGNASDRDVFLAAMILDPFDEKTIDNEDGTVATTPNDGVTAIFRSIDTRPSASPGNTVLAPYTSLVADNLSTDGHRGMFYNYPQDKMPKDFQQTGLRIYTASLSSQGPLETDPEKIPYQISECQQVDPCENAIMLGKKATDPTKRAVCAFFFASASSWDSPGMHYKSAEWPEGTRDNACKNREQPQKLRELKGKYSPDGRLTFEDNALRFWGPTYVHNPAGPADRKPPALDDVFHITFTTDVIVPKEEGGIHNYVPEERIDRSKQEYKVNLDDSSHGETIICPTSTRNKWIGDKKYSSWKYFAPFLVQDKEGTVPAGCKEPDNSLSGGRAYLRGRPVDPSTGIFSVAAVTKFSNQEDNTFVFEDVPLYIVLNGWMCDPMGSEAEGEGSKCFEQTYNERDALSAISILKDGK